MAGDDWDLPIFGNDYDLARWSDGSRDAEGKLIWETSLPSNAQWSDVRYVTLDFNPGGEPDYRNAVIPAQSPLSPYGSYNPDSDEPYFDLDDLAGEMMDSYEMAY